MSNWFKRIRDRQEGITLIELIVVVAIIGVLAWLVTPRVLATLNESKLNSAQSVATELLSAMERYGAQNNQYPSTIANWAAVSTTLDIQASGTNILDATTFSYSSTASDTFCALFQAKDKDKTYFKITKTGVQQSTAALTCP